jgi:hypothetical protein
MTRVDQGKGPLWMRQEHQALLNRQRRRWDTWNTQPGPVVLALPYPHVLSSHL